MSLHVVIAGASGLLGSALRQELAARGHRVTGLTRGQPSEGDAHWDPAAGDVDQRLIDEADVVVNLAGSPLLGNPYGRRWKTAMRESRLVPTRVLAEAIARSPRPAAMLAGNGSSYYGDHGAEPVTEESDSRGDAFMTQLTREWQAAADAAVEAGARVCYLRTAPVMDGLTLTILKTQFQLCVGGRLGSGEQYFPVLSRQDFVGAVTSLTEDDSVNGPVNLCCPHTPTNAEFTESLARAVHRPAILPVPAGLIRLGAGPAAPELTRSLNLTPAVLNRRDHDFEHPDVDAVIAAGLG